MAKAFTKKKSIWSKLTGVEDEEMNNSELVNSVVTAAEDDEETEIETIAAAESSKAESSKKDSGKEEWLETNENYEGQLSIDVFQTPDNIIIKSTIAGVKPENVDISIENDMLTIRGQRRQEENVVEEDYFYQECYWGGFSRSIILPLEVQTDKIDASLKDGVLTVVLPKAKKSRGISIKVKREE